MGSGRKGEEMTDAKQARLREVFEQVQDSEDWRAPVSAWITSSERHEVAEAIMHFTATCMRVVDRDGDRLRIEADGYRNGPAGM